MAPIPSDDELSENGSSVTGSDVEEPVTEANGFPNAILEDGEEEFHTEDSDASEGGLDAGAEQDEESDVDADGSAASGIPLLPESLLKQLPQRKPPAPSLAHIPWDQLTPKQKRARRNNSRKEKKREYDRLREEAQGTGVLEAGKAAQKKRGIVPAVKRDRVKSGRVEKKGRDKVRVSGRQQMIEQRKRAVGLVVAEGRGKAKKARRNKR